MEIIAIVNEKGGSGKTTTAVNLSAALGELNRKVLLVDLDGQAASSRWLGVEDDNRFADALWKGEGLEPILDVIPGVSLAPGSGKLDSVAHDLRPTQGGQLRKLLMNTNGFEYVIIDCPPSLGNKLIGNALLAATHAIVPVETSILALDGLKILLTTLQDIRDGFEHNIILKGVVACRFDARTKISRFILDELKRALPGKVFQTVIRENVRVRECPASGKSILEFAPDSHAAEDYRLLAREILEKKDQELNNVTETQENELPQKELDEVRKQAETMLGNFGSKPDEQTSTPAKPTNEIYNEERNAVAEPEPSVTTETQQDRRTNEQPEADKPEPPTPYEPPNRDVQFGPGPDPFSKKEYAHAGGINEERQAATATAVIEDAPAEPKQETPPKEEPTDDGAAEQQEYPALRAMLQKMNGTADIDNPAT